MEPIPWKCSKCGYAVEAETPPETCPTCKETCSFVNTACYTPDCDPHGSDERL